MQSSTGQYSTHAGDPAQPVQHSVMTASSFGFFFRGVMMPLERGSCFNSAGTIPPAFPTSRSEFMARDYIPHPIVLEHFQLQRVRRYPRDLYVRQLALIRRARAEIASRFSRRSSPL
jgi:hypothetical protein